MPSFRSRSPTKSSPPSTADLNSPATKETTDLSTAVDDLLDQLRTKFINVSEELLSKSQSAYPALQQVGLRQHVLMLKLVDDVSRRLDSIEAGLKAQSQTTGETEGGKR